MPPPSSHSPKPRIEALDQTKGVLVILMVVYHSLNYTSEYHLGFKYFSFLPPSFIFITGYLIASVYFARASANQSQVQQRLLVRGGKLLLLFTLLNVGAHSVLQRGFHGEKLGIAGFFDHAWEVYVTGSGRYAVFEVLLPIAYLLILAPILIWAGHRQRFFLPAMTIGLLALCVALEHFDYTFTNLSLLSAGALGMLAGRVPTEKINALGRYVVWAIVAYGGYYYLGASIGQYYLVQMLGATVALTLIFSLCTRFRMNDWSRRNLILLGQYSLVAYIFQIGVLQALSRFVRRPEPLSFGGLFLFTATLVLTMGCALLIDWARTRATAVEKLYKAVFA